MSIFEGEIQQIIFFIWKFRSEQSYEIFVNLEPISSMIYLEKFKQRNKWYPGRLDLNGLKTRFFIEMLFKNLKEIFYGKFLR